MLAIVATLLPQALLLGAPAARMGVVARAPVVHMGPDYAKMRVRAAHT